MQAHIPSACSRYTPALAGTRARTQQAPTRTHARTCAQELTQDIDAMVHIIIRYVRAVYVCCSSGCCPAEGFNAVHPALRLRLPIRTGVGAVAGRDKHARSKHKRRTPRLYKLARRSIAFLAAIRPDVGIPSTCALLPVSPPCFRHVHSLSVLFLVSSCLLLPMFPALPSSPCVKGNSV